MESFETLSETFLKVDGIPFREHFTENRNKIVFIKFEFLQIFIQILNKNISQSSQEFMVAAFLANHTALQRTCQVSFISLPFVDLLLASIPDNLFCIRMQNNF